MSTAVSLARRIESVLDAVNGVILAMIAVSLVYQVFGRYVLGKAPVWSEEVARMLIVWLTMLGSAACLRGGSHIAIGTLVNALPEVPRAALLWLRDIAVLWAAGVLAWSGARFALMNSDQDSPALEMPMTYVYVSLSVGATLIALQLLLSRIGGEKPVVDPLEW